MNSPVAGSYLYSPKHCDAHLFPCDVLLMINVWPGANCIEAAGDDVDETFDLLDAKDDVTLDLLDDDVL